ncbi:unnamed protein product [Trichogramma brassicae]|uniref:Uncharacterized protein n=1 Tax=Trichogramma brassicae TaxID=86971 RepID=A0A6H5I535_9HYME|nr:unnamed protein product [Trichogramma brassicae]
MKKKTGTRDNNQSAARIPDVRRLILQIYKKRAVPRDGSVRLCTIARGTHANSSSSSNGATAERLITISQCRFKRRLVRHTSKAQLLTGTLNFARENLRAESLACNARYLIHTLTTGGAAGRGGKNNPRTNNVTAASRSSRSLLHRVHDDERDKQWHTCIAHIRSRMLHQAVVPSPSNSLRQVAPSSSSFTPCVDCAHCAVCSYYTYTLRIGRRCGRVCVRDLRAHRQFASAADTYTDTEQRHKRGALLLLLLLCLLPSPPLRHPYPHKHAQIVEYNAAAAMPSRTTIYV